MWLYIAVFALILLVLIVRTIKQTRFKTKMMANLYDEKEDGNMPKWQVVFTYDTVLSIYHENIFNMWSLGIAFMLVPVIFFVSTEYFHLAEKPILFIIGGLLIVTLIVRAYAQVSFTQNAPVEEDYKGFI